MKKEDIQFLKDLQHEMNTQDTCCQADPRFWVVMQTVRDYEVSSSESDGYCIINKNDCEDVCEGDFEEMAKWFNDFDFIDSATVESGIIEIKMGEEEELIFDSNDLENFLEEYCDNYYVIYYKDREEIVQDTFFLTKRECQEHIKSNHYHYNKPHPYAMTAWRSPQVERLYKILQNTDWDKINEK